MTRQFLGAGWKFPIRIAPHGGFAYSDGEQDIAESIWIILGTAPGERHMLPNFGCGIHRYVFAANNASTRNQIALQVRTALTEWEPRIDVADVLVEASPEAQNVLYIRIDYWIRSTNSFHNLVYPFYIQEGVGA